MSIYVRIAAVPAAVIAILVAQSAVSSTFTKTDAAPAAATVSGSPAQGAGHSLYRPGTVLRQGNHAATAETVASSPTGPASILWD